MDEIQLIRGMVEQTALPKATELPPVRERLIAAARAENRPNGPATARPHRRGRRLTLVGAAGIAAAIAGVVVVAPFGGQAPSAHAEAVEMLHHAAGVARRLPQTPPRADQFVYTRTQQPDGIREAWLSVDGTGDGLIRQRTPEWPIPLPGCRDGKQQVFRGPEPLPGLFTDCTPRPAYRPDMPADADAMLAYLHRNGLDDLDESNANDRPANGDDVVYLIYENYLPPQSWAALFEAVARMPNLTIERDERDAAGRPGVRISWPDDGDHQGGELILDPATHTLLGSEDSAVLATAIVDRAGQRP